MIFNNTPYISHTGRLWQGLWVGPRILKEREMKGLNFRITASHCDIDKHPHPYILTDIGDSKSYIQGNVGWQYAKTLQGSFLSYSWQHCSGLSRVCGTAGVERALGGGGLNDFVANTNKREMNSIFHDHKIHPRIVSYFMQLMYY